MKIRLTTQWQVADTDHQVIDPVLFELLNEIANKASLRHAARVKQVSYRHAWGLIKKWEAEFGEQLLNMRRGRKANSELSGFAKQLLSEQQQTLEQINPVLDQQSQRFNDFLSAHTQSSKPQLRFFASHDLAVTKLAALLDENYPGTLCFQTHGSIGGLNHLLNGRCDVVGFHFPLGNPSRELIEQYRHCLDSSNVSLLELAVRSQGLILQKDNPKKIHTLNDLTKRSIRFINRQMDSGTRLLLDDLLKQQNILAKSINGYSHEEFTHDAVAAMIATGAADVGMGIQAAAKQFDLEFIPIIDERYVLAFADDIKSPIKQLFIRQLGLEGFQQYAQRLPGYDLRHCGKEYRLKELFETGLSTKVDTS